jgi:hypothetical protein
MTKNAIYYIKTFDFLKFQRFAQQPQQQFVQNANAIQCFENKEQETVT